MNRYVYVCSALQVAISPLNPGVSTSIKAWNKPERPRQNEPCTVIVMPIGNHCGENGEYLSLYMEDIVLIKGGEMFSFHG